MTERGAEASVLIMSGPRQPAALEHVNVIPLTDDYVILLDMTSPRRLRGLKVVRRGGDKLGCVWLVLLPLLVFLLFQFCQLPPPLHSQTGMYVDTNLTGVSLQLAMLNGHPADGNVTSPSRLRDLEQQVTESYLRVQLALAASSGSLTTPERRPLVDIGTLKDLRTFQPLLTPREKAHLLHVFELFTVACRHYYLSFFLLDSSLIGSLRHHGIIPWSDVSIKVGMSAEEKGRVREVLDKMADVTLMWPNPYSWSLRLKDQRPDPPDLLRCPYISIQFYHRNDSHVWMDTWANKRVFTAAIDRVFPLSLRPFEGQLMPVPCDVTSVLQPGAVQRCKGLVEDEREHQFGDSVVLQCQLLMQVFPFVTRLLPMTAMSILEQLTVNRTLLYSVLVDTSCLDTADSSLTGSYQLW